MKQESVNKKSGELHRSCFETLSSERMQCEGAAASPEFPLTPALSPMEWEQDLKSLHGLSADAIVMAHAQQVATARADADAGAGMVAAGDQPVEPTGGRAQNGRFTAGCKPGPGRPRRPQKRSYVEDGWLYIWCMEFEKASMAWSSLVERMGPAAARKYLAELEAEHGPIKFRGLAIDAIAAAEAKPPEIKPVSEKRTRRKVKPRRRIATQAQRSRSRKLNRRGAKTQRGQFIGRN